LPFVDIARAVKAKLAGQDLEVVRWALPAETLALEERALSAIRRLVSALEPLEIDSNSQQQKQVVHSVGKIVAELAQETAINAGYGHDKYQMERIAIEILSAILLNLGGSRQAQGEVSRRLQAFVKASCRTVRQQRPCPPTATSSAHSILANTQRHSLRDVFVHVDSVLQRLSDEDACQLLFGTLPDECRHRAEWHHKQVSSLLLRWRAKTHRAVLAQRGTQPKSDEAAMIAMAGSTAALMNVVAFLLSERPIDEVISACQQWVQTFFENATGRPANINVERVLAVMQTGLQHQLRSQPQERRSIFAVAAAAEPSAPPLRARTPTEVLVSLGVRLRSIPAEAHEALLIALDASGDTDEMFTGRPLVEGGRVSAGLGCIVKRTGGGTYHVFVYDATAIREWVAEHNTVPETREAVRHSQSQAAVIDIS